MNMYVRMFIYVYINMRIFFALVHIFPNPADN